MTTKTKAPVTVGNQLLKFHERYKSYAPKFQRVFGVKLRPFWDPLTGFDVVKFDDEFIKAGDDVSTADAVKEKYGTEALDLIKSLLGI